MKVKLLVIDDSAFMRTAVRLMVKNDPDIEVVGEARDGLSGIQMVEALNPHVVTMDVEMPVMNGLEATRIIMERFPRPIIMLSSMTERGSETTVKALAAGAVDFIPKKSSYVQLDIVQIGNELHDKIRYWGERYLQVSCGFLKNDARGTPLKLPVDRTAGNRPELVVIGASTGGPAQLPNLMVGMGQLTCPVVIAQHMPLLFTAGFAKHLKTFSGLNVLLASDGMELKPGMVAICPGGTDTIVRESLPGRFVTCVRKYPDIPIHPSVDLLFDSAARLKGSSVGVIMTGMGSDGTQGAQALADRGNRVLVQELRECIVDGMPSSAIASGVVHEVLTVDGIGRRLKKWAGTGTGSLLNNMETEKRTRK